MGMRLWIVTFPHECSVQLFLSLLTAAGKPLPLPHSPKTDIPATGMCAWSMDLQCGPGC